MSPATSTKIVGLSRIHLQDSAPVAVSVLAAMVQLANVSQEQSLLLRWVLIMDKETAISGIWRLTLVSFIFVQIIGIVVVASIMVSDKVTQKPLIIGAYILFLNISGLVLFAVKRIKKLTDDRYK